MKKWFTLSMISIVILVLGACSESKANVDLSSYPESVQNGEISVEFYDDVKVFIEDYYVVNYGMNQIYETENEHPDVILSTQYIDAISTMDKSFKENIENVKLKPKTDRDREINQLIKNTVALQKDYNKALWKKAENVMHDSQTTLFVDRAMINSIYDQLKEETE